MRRCVLVVLIGGCAAPVASAPATSEGVAGGDTNVEVTATDSAVDSARQAEAIGPDTPASEAGTEVAEVDYGEALCAELADKVCTAAKGCCAGSPPGNCGEKWRKFCNKTALGSLEKAVIAKGDIGALPAKFEVACRETLQFAAAACDKQAVERAFGVCLRFFHDKAAIGENCHVAGDLPCAGGAGRCSPKTTELYICTAAGDAAAACSLTQPCKAEFTCLDSTLTRAKTCGKPGTTCNLTDKCWDGWLCSNGQCSEAPPQVPPPSCATDAECPTTLACQAGKCAPKMCP